MSGALYIYPFFWIPFLQKHGVFASFCHSNPWVVISGKELTQLFGFLTNSA
jgi:hypothetical protein